MTQELFKNKPIVISEQDVIEQYTNIAIDFFSNILGMDYLECLVTDESDLSDFGLCGLDEEESKTVDEMNDYSRILKFWDETILRKINNKYPIYLEKTTIKLIKIFEAIKQVSVKH